MLDVNEDGEANSTISILNRVAKRIILIILGIIGALFIGCCVCFTIIMIMFSTPEPISQESKNNIKIEKENRGACLDAAKIWLKKTYGEIIYETIKIESVDIHHYADIGMPVKYLAETEIIYSTPFYREGTLFVDSKNHNVVWYNMKLLDDYVFRDKIYDKWLKKKLDIDDDNIDFRYEDG